MKELTKEETLSNLLNTSSVLSHQIWELHKRIAGPYETTSYALQDMVKLGEMAQALLELRKVESTLSKHLK